MNELVELESSNTLAAVGCPLWLVVSIMDGYGCVCTQRHMHCHWMETVVKTRSCPATASLYSW